METPNIGPVSWKHDCAALCTNDVELWIRACPHCGKPAPSNEPATPVASSNLQPSVSLKWDRDGQGGYYVEMRVSGLRTEGQAHAAMAHMEKLFCGAEQQNN